MKTKSGGERPDIIVSNEAIRFNSIEQSTLFRYIFATRFIRPTDTILDIGCGYGGGTLFLSFWSKETTGIDYSDEALRIARKLKKQYSIDNLQFVKVRGEKITTLNDKYDVITMFEVIEHINKKDGIELLGQISSLLKNNGVFVISTPYIDYRGKTYWKFHQHEYYAQELRSILKKHFTYVKAYYQCSDGSIIVDNPLLALASNPLTGDASILFVCSNSKSKFSEGSQDHNVMYLGLRGLYRNLKYFIFKR